MADATIATGERVYENRGARRDRNRRRRWLTSVHRSAVSHGCRVWLLCLAERSSDTAKPVYGRQDKQGREIARCDRSVRRYRLEAEGAGLIETRRSPVVRELDGTVRRTATNVYVFCVPPGHPKRRRSSSHRPDKGVRSNQFLTELHETLRRPTLFSEQDHGPEPFSSTPPGGWRRWRESLRV